MAGRTDDTIQIIIVDDHKILAQSIAGLIEGQKDMKMVSQAYSGQEAIEILQENQLDIDLVIMDLRMEETDELEPDGIRTARYILDNVYTRGLREVKVLILTQLIEGYLIDLAHKIGVDGYLSKDCDSEELFLAIRTVVRDKRRYFRGNVEEIWDQFSYKFKGRQNAPTLTPTEMEILQMIAEGVTTKEMARRRGRGEDGIEAHRRNLMRKFKAKNAPHLISLAYNFGLIKVV
ncbi:MAG: response regulator transcription factor [Lewinellaceae bacterium]|nr:response regulator transcription factor [Lewinellaceae bacterium]